MGPELESTGYETADAIITAVKSYGVITKASLAKWHRVGLLSRPVTVSLGRGKGSESRYPSGTLRLVIEIVKRRTKRFKHDDLAWDLWWDGYDVPVTTIRKILSRFTEKWDQGIKNNDVGRELNDLETQRLPKPMSQIRKRVGREKFRSVATAILSVVTDKVDETAVDQVNADTYDKAFNLKRARTEHTRFAGPFIQSDQHEILHTMRPILHGRSMTETLATYSNTDLGAARDAYRRLISVVGHASVQVGQMFGRGAFGFETLGSMATPQTRLQQASAIMMWPLLTADPALADGFKIFLANEETLNATDKVFEQIKHLREDVPAVGKVASLRRIGAAQKNKKKQARLDADVRRIRKKHGAEIQASLERHAPSQSQDKTDPIEDGWTNGESGPV